MLKSRRLRAALWLSRVGLEDAGGCDGKQETDVTKERQVRQVRQVMHADRGSAPSIPHLEMRVSQRRRLDMYAKCVIKQIVLFQIALS